jgi:plastocyanin
MVLAVTMCVGGLAVIGASAPNVLGSNAAPTRAATVTVKMVGDAKGYRFEPAQITVHAGDTIEFQSVTGGPHDVTFWADSIPAGAAQQLKANMPNTTGPLAGPLLINDGDKYTISTAKLTPGTYKFYCMPHLPMGMRGVLVVQ